MFPCEHSEIVENTFFEKHQRTAAFETTPKKLNQILNFPKDHFSITLMKLRDLLVTKEV